MDNKDYIAWALNTFGKYFTTDSCLVEVLTGLVEMGIKEFKVSYDMTHIWLIEKL